MNWTLKETLTKLTLETDHDWTTLLTSSVLFWVQTTPYSYGLTPYEIMFGRPFPLVPKLPPEHMALTTVHYNVFPLLQHAQETSQKDPWTSMERTPPGDSDHPNRHLGRWEQNLGFTTLISSPVLTGNWMAQTSDGKASPHPKDPLKIRLKAQCPTGPSFSHPHDPYLSQPQEDLASCRNGLIPCTHSQILQEKKDFCVPAQIVPRVYYYSQVFMKEHLAFEIFSGRVGDS